MKSIGCLLFALVTIGCQGTGTNTKTTGLHVGAMGVTCCIVPSPQNQYVLYLVNGSELHMASRKGQDITFGSSVPIGGYQFSPDGNAIFFVRTTGDGSNQKSELDFIRASDALAAAQPQAVINDGLSASSLSESFFSPSGKYFLLGALSDQFKRSPDLYVIDVNTGQVVYHRAKGAFVYEQLVTNDDTLFFQDTVGGADPATPPVQTLFYLSLPKAQSSQATAIDTRASSFAGGNGSSITYSKINGELHTFDLNSTKNTQLAADVVKFAIGSSSMGTTAYAKADGSVHVLSGGQETLATAKGAIDLLSPIVVSPDDQHVFFFQAVDTQNNQ